RGVYGVYSVQDFWSVGAKREVLQGKNLADVANKAGVEHFVYSSVGGAERNTGIDHWESKWEIENHIRKLGLPSTVLRPVAFMEGYYSEPLELSILQGKTRPSRAGGQALPDDCNRRHRRIRGARIRAPAGIHGRRAGDCR